MRMNMNKSGIKYIALSAIITLALILTGCPHNSNAGLSPAKTIKASGSVIIPSALPSEYAELLENDSSRTAASSYAQTKDGTSLSIIVYAVNKDDDSDTIEQTISSTGTFTMDFPAEISEWTIGAKCYKSNQLLMETTPRDISINQQDIESGSFKIRPFTLDPSGMTGTGSLSLPVTKAEDSSITTIKYELSSQNLTTPISGQLSFGLNSSINLAYSSLDAGTYEAAFYFIDENQFSFGPVKETIIIAPEFITDTWYASADDIFIASGAFQVPSDDFIKELFPNYTYTGPIPENTALLWNYDPVTLKASYRVHPVDENGNVDSYGISLAADKDIVDVFIDLANNDMYVLTKENSLLQYTASSGYSEYKENIAPSQNYTLITACANQGTVYVLANNSGAEPDKQIRILKFNSDASTFTEIGCLSGMSILPGLPVKMATCNGYIFVSWIQNFMNYNALLCDVFNENIKDTQNNLNSCWNNGIQTMTFSGNPFYINDLYAVSKGSSTAIPDVYLLLGFAYADVSQRTFLSAGGIRKISSTYNTDDSSYSAAWAGDYGPTDSDGFAGCYQQGVCAPEEEDSSYFYNPLKIVGKTDNKFLIADDGLLFKTGKDGKTVQSIENLDRLVTVDLTSMNPIPFADTQSVEAGFDNYYTESFFMNYKLSDQNGFSSASFFVQTNEEQATISLFDGLQVALYNDDDPAPTDVLPSKKNQIYYIKTNPPLQNAVYNAKLLCNGKDLNLDREDNPLEPEDRYYNIDPETGAFSLNKPLNFVECYYKLVIDIEISLTKEGQADIIHYDASLDVSPATDFEIKYPETLDAFHGLLDSFLIADYANVKVTINQATASKYDYTVEHFVDDIVDYYNEHPGNYLILDFTETTGLTEIPAGMFGIDCAGIKLPKADGTDSEKYLTIKAGAFYNGNRIFKGDLTYYNKDNGLKEIEEGAFALPPRSIDVQWSGQVPVYQVCTTKNNVTLLAERQNQEIGNNTWMDIIIRIITCTKHDEPFELDLTENPKFDITTGVSIDQNAFKGLPVTNVKKVEGLTYTVGQDSFAATPVAGKF